MIALFYLSCIFCPIPKKSENENNSNDISRPAAMLSCKSLGRIYAPIRVAHYRRHSREQPYAGLTSRNGHQNYFHLMIALISCPLFGPTCCTRWHQPSIDGNSAISRPFTLVTCPLAVIAHRTLHPQLRSFTLRMGYWGCTKDRISCGPR